MADIRIKDLPTTATQTASDDFIALDGTVNGTRKIDASAPSFKTSVTSPSVVAPATTNLTLAGGSTGASLVLGQGTTAADIVLTPKGTGKVGIGTTTPSSLLELSNTNAGVLEFLNIKHANAANAGGTISWGATAVRTASISHNTGALDSTGFDLNFSTYVAGSGLTEKMRIKGNGNVLIGGTTDITGSGGLKVFGTTAASSTTSGALQVAGGVGVAGAGYFGGLISTTSTGFSAINASGSVEFLGSRSSTSGGVTVTYKTGATTNWFHGLRGLVDNNWYLFNNNLSTNTLIFNSATDAATFAGAVLNSDGTAAAPSIAFSADTDTGFYRQNTNVIGVSLAGAAAGRFEGDGASGIRFRHPTGNYLGLNNSGAIEVIAAGTNQNITLTPSGSGITVNSGGGYFTGSGVPANGSAGGVEITGSNTQANVFAFRRGVGAIPLILQGAGSNVLIGTSVNSGALLQIGTNTTTSAGGMVFGTDTNLFRWGVGTLALNDGINGTPRFIMVNGGTNLADMQHNGAALVFRTFNAANSMTFSSGNSVLALTLDSSQNATFVGDVATANAKAIYWGTRSTMTSPSDGIIRFANAAGTDFSRLQFGGTTSSFPALKRSGSAIHVRFADDSAYAAIASGVHVVSGSASSVGAGEICYGGSVATTVGATGVASALPALPLGYIIINVAGTSAKIPYYNA